MFGGIRSTVDAAGNKTDITRDEYDNVVKTVYPDGSQTSARYSPSHGQILEETDELGVKTLYDYDGKAGYSLDSPEVPLADLPAPFVTVIAGRGCLYNCSFCQPAEKILFGGRVRRRSVENVIAEHPAVKEAAVIGRSDYTWGEVPVAVVALKEGQSVDVESLLAFCRKNMAAFKVPRSIDFLAALPRNSQGKVLKVRLRERAAGRRKP